MNVYRDLDELPPRDRPVIATIGNFDGVHLGHLSVIDQVLSRARLLDGRSLAITFDPHPSRLLRPERADLLLTPLQRKLELLDAAGLDGALVLPFTDDLRRIGAREFVRRVLVEAAGATELHEGQDFRFGHRGEAGIESLQALGREFGFRVVVYASRIVRGAAVSSSRIRALLREGHVSAARPLLGRPFSIDGHPAPGRGYGTRYVVPTINLAPYPELLPAHGVYITTLTAGEPGAAESFEAVTNVGVRPTFGAESFAVESHLLDFHPVALDERTPLRLTFLKRLREERRFPSPEALRDQIAEDVHRARRFFDLCRRIAGRASTEDEMRASNQG